jgi:hypothetical protein
MTRRAIAAAAIVIAAVALYAPVIDDYFIQDDFGVVSLLSQRSLAYIPRWFVTPWTEDIWGYVPDELRPFPAASYVMASWFGASAPQPNHIMNIALHAFNGLLVMWIAESAAGLSLVPAWAAGVIFVLLPIQAESVAWITGRVDSLPTLFYFASFLLYVRSVRLQPDPTDVPRGRLRPAYLWSVFLFFAALFSKQNTITMVPALVLFDWVVRRRRIEITWAWLRPYLPYIVLTIGFLALRYVLFHEVAREGLLSAQRVREFLSDSSRHLVRLVFGGPGIRHWSSRDTMFVALGAVIVAAMAWRLSRAAVGALWRSAIYFGVIWIVLGVLPILMSGYYSPRHMYLASLGWTVTVSIGLEIIWRAQPAPRSSSHCCDRGGRACARICRAAPRDRPRLEWLRGDFPRRRTATCTRGGSRSRRDTRHCRRSAIELGVCDSALSPAAIHIERRFEAAAHHLRFLRSLLRRAAMGAIYP